MCERVCREQEGRGQCPCRGINASIVRGAPCELMDGAEPQGNNHSCQRWRSKTSTARGIPIAGFDGDSQACLKPSLLSWEELALEKLRYALSKQTRSRGLNFRAADLAPCGEKRVSPSDGRTVPRGSRGLSGHLIWRLLLEPCLYPDSRPNSEDAQRCFRLQRRRLGAGTPWPPCRLGRSSPP